MMTNIPVDQTIHSGVLRRIDEALLHSGVDPSAELAELGFNAEIFNDGEHRLQKRSVAAILEHCVKVTGSRNFALHLASIQGNSYFGNLGLLMETAPTFRDALDQMVKYQSIYAPFVRLSINQFGDQVILEQNIDSSGLSPFQNVLGAELALVQAWQSVKAMTLGRARLNFVSVRHEKRDNGRAFQRIFGAPVRYGDEICGICIGADVLDVSVSYTHRALHKLVMERIEKSEVFQQEASLDQKVRTVVRNGLSVQHFHIDGVARQLSCDKRTLQRRLRAECNTTFRELLDDVRFEQAESYLRDTDMPIMYLAYVVGFSDSSNLARAFKKRFGCSPKEWRTKHTSRPQE